MSELANQGPGDAGPSEMLPEMPPRASGALDALQQEFANALVGHRACQWEAGDIAARALDACGSRKERAVLLGTLASLGHCTAGYVRTLAQTAKAFGQHARHPDIAWSLYRACLQAEKRTGRTCWDIFEEATERGWHVAEVASLGRKNAEPASALKATCGDCGARVSVSIGGCGGLPLSCPVCVATIKDEGEPLADWMDKHQLGTLS